MSIEEREQFKAPPTNPPECNSMASEARLCAQSAMFAAEALQCGKVDDGLKHIKALKYHMDNLKRLNLSMPNEKPLTTHEKAVKIAAYEARKAVKS